jgi:hypothetical protein
MLMYLHSAHSAPPALAVIFDADLNAYDAALSEGWPVPQERARTKAHAPTVEPSSAFLLRTLPRHAQQERIAA